MRKTITKFPHLRVLAVKDYTTAVEVLESMLLDLSCEFEIVDNNFEALELHAVHPFDIILFDILVLDPEGEETIRQIRNISGPHGELSIIIATSITFGHSRWINIGTSHQLKKPIKIQDLEEIFLRLASKKAVYSAHRSH
jgi:CheY-like chemotaxis protein